MEGGDEPMDLTSSPESEVLPPWVEVGNFVLVARVFPKECAWYWLGKQRPGPMSAWQRRLTLPGVGELRRHLAAPTTRAVFVHVPIRPRRPLDPGIPRMLHGDFGYFAFREVLADPGLPVVGLDFNDETELSPTALRFLERASCFFKRELPTDLARLLPQRASAAERRSLERNAFKLRPVSLGLSADRIADLPGAGRPKRHDLFFSGDMSLRLRRLEAPLLDTLKGQGVRVVRPTERLPRPEFLALCAESHLVWSPEGAGWDCFRHYEAAAAGSVPVMNAPPIRLHQALVHGRHALYYQSAHGSPGAPPDSFPEVRHGFVETVMRALEDRARLEEMGREARDFVLRHHTHEAIVRHLLETSGVR